MRCKNAGHRARFPKLLCESLAVAARKGRGVMLRRHPDIQPQTKSECGLGHIEARPAPILFKSAGALLALWYVLKRTAKVAIMKKMILAINPKARVEIHCKQWQLAGDALQDICKHKGRKTSFRDPASQRRRPNMPLLVAVCCRGFAAIDKPRKPGDHLKRADMDFCQGPLSRLRVSRHMWRTNQCLQLPKHVEK